MVHLTRAHLLRYAIALLATALALLLRPVWEAWLDRDSIFSLFTLAVTLCAWFGGMGPGLLATVVLGVTSLFLGSTPPMGTTFVFSVSWYVFLVVGVFVSLALGLMHPSGKTRERFWRRWLPEVLETPTAKARVLDMLVGNLRDIAVFTLDEVGRMQTWNLSAEGLLGYSEDEVLGKPLSLFYTPEDIRKGQPQEDLRQARSGRSRSESWRTCKDGGRFWAEMIITPLDSATAERDGFSCLIHEVHSRQNTEKLSQRMIRTLDHSANELYIFEAASLRFVQVNTGARQNIGYSAEELANMTLLHLEPDMTAGRLAAALQPLHDGATAQITYETVHCRKNGSTYPVEVRIKLSRSETPLVFVAVVQDISERKAADSQRVQLLQQEASRAEAEKAEVRFRGLLESASDAVVVIDAEGRIVLINAQTEKMFGYQREELLGQHVEILVPERLREGHVQQRNQYFSQARQRPVVTNRDLLGRRKDGGEIPVEITLTTLETGKDLWVVSVIRDMTERKRAEETRIQLALIVATSNDAIISTSLDGRIVTWNPGAERLYGYTLNEAIGQPVSILVHLDRTDSVMAIIQRIKRGERLTHYETQQVRADGKSINVSLTFSPIRDAGGTITSISMIARDITERIQTEVALRKARDELELRVAERTAELSNANIRLTEQIAERHRAEEEIQKLNADLQLRVTELASLNKELEAFSYSVSHDLRAPLRGIDGFSQALLEDCGGQLDDQAKEYLRRSRAACERMSHLIEDLLNLSRLTRSEMRCETVNLSGIAQSIAAELQQRDPHRHVSLHIADDLTARGDPRLLRVAVENLLENAWKFTGKRPLATIEFAAQSKNGQTTFFVRDDGAGFDMTFASKIFGPFQRLHPRSEFEGTGVGLATVQRIINRHGGRVWAEAAVNQGATIYFTL